MTTLYREGDVFALPLRAGGFAVGVIARVSVDNSGGLLGYFFAPKFSDVPDGDIVDTLKPAKALKVLRFGDLALLHKEWPIIGEVPGWYRDEWPMPDFVRRDDILKKAWRVRYSDDDVCKVISEQPEPFDSPLERASTFGYGAVELLLTRLLE